MSTPGFLASPEAAKHSEDWVGPLGAPHPTPDDSALVEVAFSMVRHSEGNETRPLLRPAPGQGDGRADHAPVATMVGTMVAISGIEVIV